jgi:hypothetical protein
MNITGGSIFLNASCIRPRERMTGAGFFFPAIAWPGDLYTRLERVE